MEVMVVVPMGMKKHKRRECSATYSYRFDSYRFDFGGFWLGFVLSGGAVDAQPKT